MTEKQEQVISYLSTVDSATKTEIYNNVDFKFNKDWQHHLGELLLSIIQIGAILKLKRGIYSKNPNYKNEAETLSLF